MEFLGINLFTRLAINGPKIHQKDVKILAKSKNNFKIINYKLEFLGVPWSSTEFLGVLWSSMEFLGINL